MVPIKVIQSSVVFHYLCFIVQVLDEADRLIEDDFGEQLETIFKVLPKKRQTLLFSATMTKHLKDLQDVAMNKPFFWQQKSEYGCVLQVFPLLNMILKAIFLWRQKCSCIIHVKHIMQHSFKSYLFKNVENNLHMINDHSAVSSMW